uniref:developmental pluripotency-associated protein 3-like n=1 Tax=Odobenus rosmarus divergens TaxID=9708 RepID=UPI00063CF751|nr:PREDICTED: developmental pluripotency-associated protein 3-like [Odobenus rosmarus divergens]
MDSPKQLYPTWAPGSSQMPSEENSQEGSAASQTVSEVLIKNLSKLTLDPSIKLPSPLPEYPSQQQGREKKPQGLVERNLSSRRRTGVRTLVTARKERMARMMRLIQYQRYLSPGPQLQKDLQQKEAEEGESRVERCRRSRHHCLYHKDLSEDTSMENNYDTEPM